MSEAWLHFAILISLQFLLFFTLAYYQKKLSNTTQLLVNGLLIGLVFGLVFDFVFGRLLGLASYELGFSTLFMLLNAIFSYGLYSATMLLFQGVRLQHLFAWSFLVMAVYEITNHFFRVWTWEFSLQVIPFLVVLTVGYFGGAVLVVSAGHIFLRYRLT